MRRLKRSDIAPNLLAVFLSLLFLAGVLIYWGARPPSIDLQIEIETQEAGSGNPALRWNGKPLEPASISRRGLRVRVNYNVPRKPPEDILLWMGETGAGTDFISLSLRGPLGLPDYRLAGLRLRRLFHLRRASGGRLQATGRWLSPDPSFYKALASLHRDSRFFDLLAVALAFLFFLLLRGVDWRFSGLRFRGRVFAAGGGIFALLIGFPLTALILGIDPALKLEEKRIPARLPEFRWMSPLNFLPRLSFAYDDNFPWRPSLITLHNRILFAGLGVSSNAQVLVGKDGWLFSDGPGEFPGSTDYFRAMDPFSQKELQDWAALLEERRSWLEARGIAYIFVVAPNANTIYPEFMPDRIRKVGYWSRLDQLLAYLKFHSRIETVDLRPALRKAKSIEKVYYQTDTHWNEFGGFIAAREILIAAGRLVPGARPLPLSRFRLDFVAKRNGDLSLLLGLNHTWPWERAPRLAADPPLGFQERWLTPRHLYTDRPGAPLSGLVFCGDSFYEKLVPYLAAVTEHAHFIEDGFIKFFNDFIDRERPRLVIDELTERKLMSPVPANPPEIRGR